MRCIDAALVLVIGGHVEQRLSFGMLEIRRRIEHNIIVVRFHYGVDKPELQNVHDNGKYSHDTRRLLGTEREKEK